MDQEFFISIKGFFRILWKEKWWIALITILFGGLGAIYSFSLQKEFVSEGKILPEAQSKGAGLGQFSGLAALAGVDLGSVGAGGGDAVQPGLYPNVITSTPFYLELFKAKVRTKDNKEISFEQYYHTVIEKGKKPKQELLKKYPVKEEGIIVLNKLNEIRLKELRKRISSTIEKKTGLISISTKMPDPVIAAEVSRFAMNYLMEYISNYRTEKLRKDVNFLAEQVSSSRGKYYSSQQKKAAYSDQYQVGSMRLQSADLQRERIESDYRLSSSFYNELLKKYEEAKFRLNQETPVFKVLEPPVTPVRNAEPRRIRITLIAMILGVLVSVVFVLLKGGNYRQALLR